MKDAKGLFREICGKDPDTSGGEYRLFCLALYLCNKQRNRNATPEHKEKITKKNPGVLKYTTAIMEHSKKVTA